MTTPPDNPTPGQCPSQWRVWFALLGGGVAWAAHFLLAYGIAEFGCGINADAWGWLNVSAVAWAILAVSVLMLALAVAATLVARGLMHDTAAPSAAAPRRATRRRAGRLAVWLDGLFVFVIAFQTLPIFFYLGQC